MNRAEIINKLIQTFKYENYLEIGIGRGFNYNQINCVNKTSVDPNPKTNASCPMESDQFFKINKTEYDIIFIDGLHHQDQCFRDILNSLKCLKENGTIVVHDCNPRSCESQLVPRIQEIWNGDVWKAWVKLRSIAKALDMFVVDTDEGCGIIRRGNQRLITDIYLKYGSFVENKINWLNLKPIEYFEKWLISKT